MKCAEAALEGSKNSQLRNSMQQNRENQNQIGKDGNNGNGKDNGKRTRSVDLFLRHKRAEIETELETISECLQIIRSSLSSQFSSSQSQSIMTKMQMNENNEILSRNGLFQILSRVLIFGFNGAGDFDDRTFNKIIKEVESLDKNQDKNQNIKKKIMKKKPETGLTTKLIFALRDKFGLDRIQKYRCE